MKSFTDRQAAAALVVIFLVFCFVSDDDFYIQQSIQVALNDK